MTALPGLALALGTIVAAGTGLLRLLCRAGEAQTRGESAALVWLLGSAWVSLGIFALGSVVTGQALVAALALGAGGLWFATRRAPVVLVDAPRLSRGEWVLVGLLALEAVAVVWSCTYQPLGWDGLCTWDGKAQIAFANGGALPPEYFHDSTRTWSRLHYPLGLPYLNTWLYLCLGQVDQAWVRGIGAAYYVACVALLAGAVARLGGQRWVGLATGAALFFVPAVSTSPFGHFSGYADFPLAVVILAAAVRLPGWRTSPSLADERVLSAMLMLLVWTKREGFVPAAALLAVAALALARSGRWKRMIPIAAPMVALGLAFAVYLRSVGVLGEADNLPPTLANFSANAGRLAPLMQFIGFEVIRWEYWSVLWPATLLALITLGVRGQAAAGGRLALVMLLPWPAYLGAYVLSTWPDFFWYVTTSLSRLALQFAPLALLSTGLAMGAAYRVPSERQEGG